MNILCYLISKTLPEECHCIKKMKFCIKNFFSKCDQIWRKLRIWSHLLKKSLMENFIFRTFKILFWFEIHKNFINLQFFSWDNFHCTLKLFFLLLYLSVVIWLLFIIIVIIVIIVIIIIVIIVIIVIISYSLKTIILAIC